ncbi:MAG: 23S rRNA pseudouridine synthase [Candidatus Tokpelaia sp. JSC161]|jgi:23S rRNA pseudouridine1911/1915/1917 synthase|nr:MAG: 23S rRNA pseudouridine synthase [Candidatus Tokpelaia sp. JSC161]
MMEILVTDDHAYKKRIDQWIVKQLEPKLSRSRLQKLIRNGEIKVNNEKVLEPSFKLSKNLKISIHIPPAIEYSLQGENIELDILYEDEDIIVLNKTAGLVVHPGHGNWQGTLVNALIYHFGKKLPEINGIKRPGIVHRLDKNTTGTMIIAKNEYAHQNLSKQFADHGYQGILQRKYIALIWGIPNRKQGTINLPLTRSSQNRTRQTIAHPSHRGKIRHATTHYRLLKKFSLASLIECQLETGRTHQIRVHMAHIGHPLIGDSDYGNGFKTKVNRLPEPARTQVNTFQRQALHAYSLRIQHPSNGKIMNFIKEVPHDMQKIINMLLLTSKEDF